MVGDPGLYITQHGLARTIGITKQRSATKLSGVHSAAQRDHWRPAAGHCPANIGANTGGNFHTRAIPVQLGYTGDGGHSQDSEL